MYFVNSCKYNVYKETMHGREYKGCTHPMRKSLDGFLDKVFGVFDGFRDCAAAPGMQLHCPYYKDKYKRTKPPQNPFSSKVQRLFKEEKTNEVCSKESQNRFDILSQC